MNDPRRLRFSVFRRAGWARRFASVGNKWERRAKPALQNAIVALLAVCTIGCSSLPRGSVDRIAIANASPQIVLVRGWLDLYSTGIDQLADELKSAGYAPLVYRDSQSHALGEAIVDHYRAHSHAPPLVLIGFSYGADDVVKIGRKMNDAGEPLPLLITIDPVTPGYVSPNVLRCYDLYQSNGWVDVFPFFRGIPLEGSDQRPAIINIDIHQHPDLDDPSVGHAHIAGYAKVHQAILNLIRQTYPPSSTHP